MTMKKTMKKKNTKRLVLPSIAMISIFQLLNYISFFNTSLIILGMRHDRSLLACTWYLGARFDAAGNTEFGLRKGVGVDLKGTDFFLSLFCLF